MLTRVPWLCLCSRPLNPKIHWHLLICSFGQSCEPIHHLYDGISFPAQMSALLILTEQRNSLMEKQYTQRMASTTKQQKVSICDGGCWLCVQLLQEMSGSVESERDKRYHYAWWLNTDVFTTSLQPHSLFPCPLHCSLSPYPAHFSQAMHFPSTPQIFHS